MAERTLEFSLTYDPRRVDEAYVDRQQELATQRALMREAMAGEAPAGPEGPPDVPGRQPTGEKPSPLLVGLEAAGKAAGEAAKAAWESLRGTPPAAPTALPLTVPATVAGMTGRPDPLTAAGTATVTTAGAAAQAIGEGVTKLAVKPGTVPGGYAQAEEAKAGTRGAALQLTGEVLGGLADKAAGVRQIMMEGLMGLGMAPLIGAGAGWRQATRNAGIAHLLVADPINASFLRMITSGVNPFQPATTPEEQAQREAMWAPMDLGEFGEILIQNAPLVAGGARKVGLAAQIQAPNIAGEAGRLRIRGEVTPTLTRASTTYNDLKNTAASVFQGGARTRKAFDAAMLEAAGEPVRPHLATLYADAPTAVKTLAAATTGGRLPAMRELLKKFKLGEFGMEWYGAAHTELQALFGQDGGLVGDLIAATSQNTSLDSNITKTLNLYEKFKAGMTPEQVVAAMDPKDAHRKNVANAFAGRPIEGPKIGEFAKAIAGDPEAVVQDLWMQRVFNFKGDVPTESQRAFVAATVTREAQRLGIEPRAYQAALWIAQKIIDESATMGKERATQLAGRSLTEVVREKIATRAGKAMATDLQARLAAPDGGFSVNLVTGQQPTTGQMVAIYPARGQSLPGGKITQKRIAQFIEANRDLLGRPDHHFGGWHDPTDGKVWLDVSVRTETADAARALAEQHGEKAYYDLDAGRSVRTEEGAAHAQAAGGVREGGAVDDGGRRREDLRSADGEEVGPDRPGARGDRGDLEGAALEDLPDLGPTGQAGRVQVEAALVLARVVAGALAGAETGDDFESRLRNALVGAGLGALASKAMLARAKALAVEGGVGAAQALKAQRANLLSERGSGTAGGMGVPEPPPGGRGTPPPEGAPTPEMRLNLERVEASERVKGVMADLNRLVGEKLLAEHREVKGHEQTKAEAAGISLDQVLASDPATTSIEAGRAVQHALREQFNAAATHLEAELRALPARTGGAPDPQFYEAFALAVKLAALDERFGAGFARGTEARKIVSTGATPTAADSPFVDLGTWAEMAGIRVRKPGAQGFDPGTIVDLAQELVAADDAKILPDLMRNLTKPQRLAWYHKLLSGGVALRDLLHLTYINGLLSDPTTTHVANIAGTALIVPWEMAVRQTAEIIHAATSRDPAGVQFGETLAMVRSMTRANQTALQFMSERARTGMQPFEQVNVSNRGPITPERYGHDPNTVFGRFVGTLGAALESKAAPVTWMGVEDAYHKGINYHLEGSSLGLRKAMAELPDGTAKAVEERARFLEQNPTDDMLVEMQHQALLRTLNGELGPTGAAFSKFVDAFPLGRWIVPFKRTPVNALTYVRHNTPVLNMLQMKAYKDIVQGTAAEREMALARLALGWGVGLAIAGYVHSGNITGDGITDQVKRKFRQFTDRPANTIGGTGEGDKRYTYDRLDPVGGMIGAVATFEELRANIPQEQGWLDYVGANVITLAMALGTVFSNKAYLQTVGNIIDSIKQPGHYAATFTRGMARSMVPSFVRHIARSADDNIVREVTSVNDALRAAIPLWGQGIPPQRHPVLSDPVLYPPGVVGDYVQAVRVYEVKKDPVMRALDEHEAMPTPLPWWIAGTRGPSGFQVEEPTGREGTKLTDKERDRWGELIGTQQLALRDRPQILYEALHDLVTSKDYQTDWPKALRARELKRIQRAYREAALKTVQQESQGDPEGLVARLMESEIRQMKALAPKSKEGELNEIIRSLGR